jgi:hypothetical protein
MSEVVHQDQKLILQIASIIKPGVNLIGIINKKGRMMDWIGKGGIEMPGGIREMFFMKISLRSAMQKEFDEVLDPVKYCVTYRGGKKFISIPTFNDNTVLVVTKANIEHEKLADEIIQTLKQSDEFLGQRFSR